jgi:tRNA A-37 threonylcarbamoyl transferase component Bud32/TolB-like protein
VDHGARLKEGDSLLHYRILSRLGEGGMGVVYRAEDQRLGRHVALKVLREELASDREWNRRFEHEVRAASAVTHPGIATVYDFHHEGKTAFLTMEFVEGRTLRDVLEDGPLPVHDLLEAAWQMAEAIGEAHRKGVIHRDLKPENVIASTSGYYKILDFGLARLETAEGTPDLGSQLRTVSTDASGSSRLVGTVTYMSPEQAQGLPVDARSDLFTFGSLVYELATGKPAFRRHNAIATFHAIVHEDPEPLASLRPDVPAELERIVGACLQKDPERRPRSAADLQRELRALARGGGYATAGERAAAPVARARRPWIWMAGAAAVILIAALAAVWGPSSLRRTAPPAAPATGAVPPAPGGDVVQTAAASASADTLAVSAFANNTGDPSADWMSRGVAEMMTSELTMIGRFRVISTQRLNDLLSMTGRSDLRSAEGKTVTELARWAGAGVVVTGSIVKVAGGYRVDVQASDTTTGQVMAAAKTEGPDVGGMPPRLAASLDQGLGGGIGHPDRTPGHPGAVTTAVASDEATRWYAQGKGLYENLRFAEAADSFRRAVDADPGYSVARMRLGMSLYLQGRKNDGLEAIRQVAAKGLVGLPERERRLATILDEMFRTRRPEAAQRALDEYVKRYPADVEGDFWKAQGVADIAGDPILAIRILRSILEKEPDNLAAVSAMSMHIARLGSPADAKSILEDCLGRHPEAEAPLTQLIESCDRMIKNEAS